jgi:hypothetical protein
MQKGQQSSPMSREYVVAHGLIVDETGAPGIDSSGGSRRQANLIRVDGGLVTAVVEVTVDVNQTWSNQLAGDIHRSGCVGGIYPLRYLGYEAIFEGNVPASIDSLGRVQYGSSGE